MQSFYFITYDPYFNSMFSLNFLNGDLQLQVTDYIALRFCN